MPSLTPEQFFLRYAFVCVDIRLARGLITEGERATLASIMVRGEAPERTLLVRCFPDATKGLTDFATAENADPWSMEMVTEYWHHRHGREGDCRVLHGDVVCIYPQNKVEVLVSSEGEPVTTKYFALNLYEIPIAVGDRVTTHKRIIIERLPK